MALNGSVAHPFTLTVLVISDLFITVSLKAGLLFRLSLTSAIKIHG